MQENQENQFQKPQPSSPKISKSFNKIFFNPSVRTFPSNDFMSMIIRKELNRSVDPTSSEIQLKKQKILLGITDSSLLPTSIINPTRTIQSDIKEVGFSKTALRTVDCSKTTLRTSKSLHSSQKRKTLPKKNSTRLPLNIHGRNRYYKTKTEILKNVCGMLTDLFKNNSICSERPKLTTDQVRLVEIIARKKFDPVNVKLKISTNPFIYQQRLGKIDKLRINHESKKRTEENIKFVYKHTLKYLKSQFYDQNKIRFNKESEIRFYEHYFSKLAKEKNVALRLFFDPLTLKGEGERVPKTISQDHLQLLFSCSEFKSLFVNYAKNEFKNDYQSSIYRKLERILFPLEKELREGEEGEKVREFAKGIAQAKKLKLPWTVGEIEVALTCFLKRVDKSDKPQDKSV